MFNKKPVFKDIMIDFETLDNKPTSKVLSVSMVYFCRKTGKIGDFMQMRFSSTAGLNRDRTTSQSTLDWWKEQPQEVFANQMSGTDYLDDLLKEFERFYDGEAKLWGNGSIFDLGILDNIINQSKAESLYGFWVIRDVRTVVDLDNGVVGRPPPPRDAHDSYADCLYQIDYVSRMIISLSNPLLRIFHLLSVKF